MRKSIWLGLLSPFVFGVEVQADVIYDNLDVRVAPLVLGVPHDEVADELILAPGPRFFESAEVAFSGAPLTGTAMTLTLYAMDGAPTSGSQGFDTPGTVLFTQTVPISSADATASFSDPTPSVLLPDVIGLGIKFVGAGMVLLFDPPTVGSSFDDYFLDPSPGDWELLSIVVPANFGARITAVADPVLVPEPASLGLIGVGLVGIALIRRRRAQTA